MYYSTGHYQVELYTSTKDLAAEAKVEAALDGLCWEKSEEYIDAEKIYQLTTTIASFPPRPPVIVLSLDNTPETVSTTPATGLIAASSNAIPTITF